MSLDGEDRRYEQAVLDARKVFFIYGLIAILIPLAAVGMCYGLQKPSTWIARSGAVMAGVAFLADLKARAMAEVFKPSGFVDKSFAPTRDKYLPQVKLFSRLSIALVLIGTAVWGFGDLLPSAPAAG